MKIGEYEQMMAYLTRPGFNGGSGKKPTTVEELKKSGQIVTGDKYKPSNPKLIKAIRDFELRNPRKNKSEGGSMVPEPKPLTEEIFKENADRFIKGALGGFPKDEMITKLQEQLDKVQESGTFSKEQAINFINERTKQLREFIKQNPGETLPGLETREGFKFGTEPDTIKEIKDLLDDGKTINEVAEFFKVSRSTMKRAMADAGIKLVDQAATTEELTNIYNTLKTELGRDPTMTEMVNESGRPIKTIKRNIGDFTFSEGRSLEGAGQKGLDAAREYFKTRKIDKPTHSTMDGGMVRFPNPEMEQEYIDDLVEIFSKPKAARTNEFLAKKYNISLDSVEKINSVFIRDMNLQHPPADSAATNKKRLDRVEKVTGPQFKYQKGTPEYPFHHIKQIGGEVPLTKNDVAFISKAMNSKLSPYNKKLNNIADEISDTITASFKAMENKNEGEALDLLKKVDVLNKEAESIVNEAVETLPKKYKPYIGFNKFYARTNEYGFPLDDKVRVEPIGGGQQAGEIEKPLTKYDEKEAIDFKRRLESKLRKKIGSKSRKKIGSKSQKGFIDPKLLGADKLAKAITLYGPAAGKIAQTTLKGAGSVFPVEGLFMGDMQQRGLSPKEMALDIGTVGIGTIFKDIKEKADYVKSKGLGDELQSALRKQTVAQQARPTLGGVEGMFKEPTLTDDEQRALKMYNLDAQNIIDMRRQYQSGEYEEMDKAFGYEDPIMRGGAMNGGIMRLGFADGPSDPSKRTFIKIMGGLASIPIFGKFFKPAAKITEAAAPVIQKTFEGAPTHFINLYKKIKNLGDDVTKKSATKEREVVTEYEDYRLTEDVTTGETTIQRVKLDSDFNYYDENLAEETYMNYKPGIGQADETTGKVADEYVEDTSYIRTSGPQKGEIYDTVDGVPDDVIQDGTKFEDDFMDFEPKKKNDK